MGYKFMGSVTAYGDSGFFFDSQGSPKMLKHGDWIDSEDIAYFLEYHPDIIQEFPGEGPERPAQGTGATGPTIIEFNAFVTGRPDVPPPGTYYMYMKGDGKVYLLGPDGRERFFDIDQFTQTVGL